MMKLYIWGARKEVANDIEELREFFKSSGGKEIKKPSDPESKDVIEAEDDNGTCYFFEFPEAKMKKVVRTIMPSLMKKQED